MEANHTRIYGVAHCGPLSEQPVTTRPSRFLGYIPEGMSPPPSTVAEHIYQQQQIANENQVSPLYVPPAIHRPPDHSEFRTVDLSRRTLEEHQHISLEPDVIDENPSESQDIKFKRANVTAGDDITEKANVVDVSKSEIVSTENRNATENLTTTTDTEMQNDEPPSKILLDPIAQERQLSKMATEIEILRSQIEQLAQQNKMLLNQQKMLSKTEQTDQTEQPFKESSQKV